MRHHEASNRELIILHQSLKTLIPVFTQARLERLKRFADVMRWLVDEPDR